MATIELELRFVNSSAPTAARDDEPIRKWDGSRLAYRCHIGIIREEDGSFSVIVLNLPGAGSCGATEEEAIANAREAVLGVIQSYQDDGIEVPWSDPSPEDVPTDARCKWILVNA